MRSGKCACWATRLESMGKYVAEDGCIEVDARVTRLVRR